MGCVQSQPFRIFRRRKMGNVTQCDRPASTTVYQPLHPLVRPLLDTEYVAFHDRYVQYVEPEQSRGWDKSLRTRYTWPHAGSPVVPVGSVKDIRPCGEFDIRVFTPVGTPPAGGWPLLIWLHGGGFVGGNLDSDNDICSLACRDVGCVVANVDYRLAPEHPFPAAVEDVEAVLRWTQTDTCAATLGVNSSKIAIGGASAGANLAAVGALMSAEMSITLAAQVLVVPVCDNTATCKTLWRLHPHAPWLTPQRMTLFRNLYVQNEGDARLWKASPLFAPRHLLAKAPKAFITIAKQDMLSTEGLQYAESLKELGVETVVHEYEGMPHSMMALSGVLTKGRQALEGVVEALRISFHPDTTER